MLYQLLLNKDDNCSMGFQRVKFSLTILMVGSDMPYLPCSVNSSRGVFVTCRVIHGPCLCEHWHCALVGNAGNLHFSNIEMSDDRAGLHYVCIVQNTRLRSLMQGDDQKIEPTPRPGTAAAWFHCPTASDGDGWYFLDHCKCSTIVVLMVVLLFTAQSCLICHFFAPFQFSASEFWKRSCSNNIDVIYLDRTVIVRGL